MGRIYEVYIDVLAVNNFFADFAALAAVNYFMRRGVRVYRILSGALCAACGNCLAFVICQDMGAYLLVVHFLLNPLALYICFQEKSRTDFLADLGISYCAFLLLGGVMEWLYADGRGIFSYGTAAVTAVLLLLAALWWSRRCLKKRSRYLTLRICQQGVAVRVQALSDSGNLLTDPYTGKPVSMLDRVVYEKNYGAPQPVRLIPYESLGCRHGLLEAVTIEKMSFAYGNRKMTVHQAVIGLTDHALFEKKPYQMIINPQELSDEKPENPTGGEI